MKEYLFRISSSLNNRGKIYYTCELINKNIDYS